MKFRWLFILLVPAVVIAAWIGTAYDAREQTVFLERVAEAVERTRMIPPETDQAIKDTVASIRRRATPANDVLGARQQVAIERIQSGLAAKETARTGTLVSRQLPYYVPSE